MSRKVDRQEIERRLEAFQAPEPPPELLAALRQDIPEDLAGLAGAEGPPGAPVHRWRLAAAALFVAVVGIVIADRVRQGVPLEAETETAAATAEPTATATATAEPIATASEPPPEPVPEAAPPGVDDAAAPVAKAAAPEGSDRDSVAQTAQAPTRSAPGPATGPLLERLRRLRDSAAERDEASAATVPGEAGGRAAATEAPVAAPDPERHRAGKPSAERPATPPTSAPVPRREAGAIYAERRLLEQRTAAPPAPSTGGTAEPNDQPYGDVFFESEGVNPAIDTEDDPLSTFGLDVDTGSYTVTRGYLERGHLPPPDAVRVEEFVNFFSYGDAPPAAGDFALSAEGAPSPFADGPRYQVLRFGIHGRVVDRAARRPAVLVFVVDVSGSMGRDDRLGLVRRSLRLLLDELYPDDRVGLVVYGSRGEVLLEPTSDHQAIAEAIERLRPGGATNAEEGLVLGYELARRHFREGASHRVILCSDGVANVGRTGPESILGRIAAAAEEGIELTTIGFGMGNYNDVLMEQLADRGDGRYAYVDTLAEARRLFVQELTGTLETIASDARVQVEFHPEAVSRYRLLGYENRDIADERFRDDTVDAGEIGAGHQVSAVYEIKLAPDTRPRQRLARLSLRYRSAASGEVEETALEVRVRDLAPSWEAASPGLRLASLVAEFAEILRRSYWARGSDLDDLLRRAQELAPELAGDPEAAELTGLIAKAAQLARD